MPPSAALQSAWQESRSAAQRMSLSRILLMQPRLMQARRLAPQAWCWEREPLKLLPLKELHVPHIVRDKQDIEPAEIRRDNDRSTREGCEDGGIDS